MIDLPTAEASRTAIYAQSVLASTNDLEELHKNSKILVLSENVDNFTHRRHVPRKKGVVTTPSVAAKSVGLQMQVDQEFSA